MIYIHKKPVLGALDYADSQAAEVLQGRLNPSPHRSTHMMDALPILNRCKLVKLSGLLTIEESVSYSRASFLVGPTTPRFPPMFVTSKPSPYKPPCVCYYSKQSAMLRSNDATVRREQLAQTL